MKETDLHLYLEAYYTYYGVRPEVEISQGSTDALHYKLRYIDDKIAEYEGYFSWCNEVEYISMQRQIRNMITWYTLIEREIYSRSVDKIVGVW
jgi:hypothetical protein